MHLLPQVDQCQGKLQLCQCKIEYSSPKGETLRELHFLAGRSRGQGGIVVIIEPGIIHGISGEMRPQLVGDHDERNGVHSHERYSNKNK